MGKQYRIRMVIDNGYLRFAPDSVPEGDFRDWLENMAPEDMMHGVWTVGIDVSVDAWGEDGPTLKPKENNDE